MLKSKNHAFRKEALPSEIATTTKVKLVLPPTNPGLERFWDSMIEAGNGSL